MINSAVPSYSCEGVPALPVKRAPLQPFKPSTPPNPHLPIASPLEWDAPDAVSLHLDGLHASVTARQLEECFAPFGVLLGSVRLKPKHSQPVTHGRMEAPTRARRSAWSTLPPLWRRYQQATSLGRINRASPSPFVQRVSDRRLRHHASCTSPGSRRALARQTLAYFSSFGALATPGLNSVTLVTSNVNAGRVRFAFVEFGSIDHAAAAVRPSRVSLRRSAKTRVSRTRALRRAEVAAAFLHRRRLPHCPSKMISPQSVLPRGAPLTMLWKLAGGSK